MEASSEKKTVLYVCAVAHPSRHDGVDIFGVTQCQSHEVSIQRSDSLEHQPDVMGRSEVQQGRGGVIRTWSAIDQRRVDLYTGRQVNTNM